MPKKARSRQAKSAGDPLKRYRRRTDVLMRQVGFDLALYDPAMQTMHILNPVAAVVWHHVTPGRTLKNVVDALQLSFGRQSCDSNEVTDDVAYVIQSFARARLLVPSRSRDPKADPHRRPVRLPIPDREISSFAGYARPTFKTYGLAELEELFSLNRPFVAPFSDLATSNTWASVT